jgi:Mg2+-importing ATPase
VKRDGSQTQRWNAGPYWALQNTQLFAQLNASLEGLSQEEASRRIEVYGFNRLQERQDLSPLGMAARQLHSPLLLLLVFAAAASAISGQWVDATIVLTIVIASAGIGYSREYSAHTAAAALRQRLKTRCTVLRDGTDQKVSAEHVVPGDVVFLAAGSLVPADGRLLQATDFFVSEAALTGESFPVQKRVDVLKPAAGLAHRFNCVFMGTNVRSGTARFLVVATGSKTEFGAIARRLRKAPPETGFDRGIRLFGYLLTTAMLALVLVIFVLHVLMGHQVVNTLLFSVALAVGLSPELLPAILSINLARGSQIMARRGVLVRRLNAIENLGSMDVLCTDKTGTLTEGVVKLEGAYDAAGAPSQEVFNAGALNATLETGIASPLDDAIITAGKPDLTEMQKLAEIPFDFVRKRVTVVVKTSEGVQMLTKGAFHRVLEICSHRDDGTTLTDEARSGLENLYSAWEAQGIRVLAVATRLIAPKSQYERDDERDMTFLGFLTFHDRPKEGIAQTVAELAAIGVSIKVITGDSRLVAQQLARIVGLRADRVLTGDQLDDMHDEALAACAEETTVFAEVDPNQKEKIILSLKKRGHIVGFLGDGINDAPAMHAADTSLSVEEAVDVAREAADFVLLERSLDVIRRGVEEGRKIFANTTKYILMTTSANLGNMLSMAIASLFLPFLPLTAGQILLNNFLSDVPAIGIADDNVDPEITVRPRRWDMKFIGRYMVSFGAMSSMFDLMTFVVLLKIFRVAPELFRTAWFVESLLTELVIALVIRTQRPFFRSRPGRVLLISTAMLIPIAFVIPYAPFGKLFGFVSMPGSLVATIALITLLYIAATELQKRWFYRRNLQVSKLDSEFAVH